MSVFNKYMGDILKKMHQKNDLSEFDKEIIGKTKMLVLEDECKTGDGNRCDIFRITINEVIRKNPELKNIIMDELATQYFNFECLDPLYIVSHFGKEIGEKMMTSSNTFDIILIFDNGKQIKTHTQILSSVGCFKFIADFPDDDSKHIREEKVNFDYDNIRIIIDYLYLGIGNIDSNNYIDYILLIDSVDIETDDKLFPILYAQCLVCFEQNIINCFENNSFYDFLHKFDILLDIFINNDSTMTTKTKYLKIPNYIRSLYKNYGEKFNVIMLLESQFFTKRLLYTKYGYQLIEETKYFPLFKYIINGDNYDKLFEIVIATHEPNMLNMLLPFVKNVFKFNNNNLIEKLPIEAFNHPIYEKLTNKNKISLIVTHKQYEYLNTLLDLSKYGFEYLTEIMKDTNDAWKELSLKQQMISSIIIYKQKICIAHYNNFVSVNKIYPLSFSSYMYIGNFNTIINEVDFGICIDIAVYNSYLKTGQKIIVSDNHDYDIQNYTFTIKNVYPYFSNDVDKCDTKLLLGKHSPKINIIFENIDFEIPKILVNTNVFCETDSC